MKALLNFISLNPLFIGLLVIGVVQIITIVRTIRWKRQLIHHGETLHLTSKHHRGANLDKIISALQKTVQLQIKFGDVMATLPFRIPIASLFLGEISRVMENFGINRPIRFFILPNQQPQDECVGINQYNWDLVLKGQCSALVLTLHVENKNLGWLFLYRVFQDYLVWDKCQSKQQSASTTSDSCSSIVSQHKLKEKHPEFFALDANIIDILHNVCYVLQDGAKKSRGTLHLSIAPEKLIQMKSDMDILNAIGTVLDEQKEEAKK